jgi:hypothetical protein
MNLVGCAWSIIAPNVFLSATVRELSPQNKIYEYIYTYMDNKLLLR